MKLCIPWIKVIENCTSPLIKMGDNYIYYNIFSDIEDIGRHRSEVLFKELSKENRRIYGRSGSKEIESNQKKFKRVKKNSIEQYWKKLEELKIQPSASTIKEHKSHLEFIKGISK